MSAGAKRDTNAAGQRVLMLLSNGFDPDPRVYNEARTLVQHGYRVCIVAWDRERVRPVTETIDGINIERVFVRSTHGRGFTQMFIMPLVLLMMVKRALRVGFDLVHAHDFDTLPAAFILGLIKRTPVVYDSHEDYTGMLHGSIPGWLETLIRGIESWLVRRVDLLLTVGETLRRQFEKRGCRNAQVLGNWKPLEEFVLPETARMELRTELNVPADALLVLYISNLGRERHVEELLEAAATRPNVHVVVGGAGPSAATVQEYAQRFSNITYLGFVQQSEIPRYTVAADLVYYGYDVNSPNAQFSAPNKLFEALAAGRPLLTARFGEIGQIVTGYGCGHILNDYSVAEIGKGLDACSHPALLNQLKAAAARAGQGEYNWRRAEQVLLGAYAALLPGEAKQQAANVAEVVAR